jgi:hypothetical protein
MVVVRELLFVAFLARSVFAGLISRHVIEDLRSKQVRLILFLSRWIGFVPIGCGLYLVAKCRVWNLCLYHEKGVYVLCPI